MILAAPLVIPFAKAVPALAGIIGGIGMTALSNKVNEYIQDNPEESMKILSTIIPGVGIGEIFMSKEDSGDDEEVEVEEDTRSKKEIVLGELGKEKGNYSDEDAEGKYASKRGRIIRALEDAGKVNPDKEYNPEKKYQGYKRFLKKADGGSIGIEVLFEPKRKDFNIGGNVQRVTTPQPYDARASAADFARAIDRVGAGTDMQKAMAIQDYGQNVQRQNLESNINALKAAASVPYNFAKGIIGNFNNPQDLTQVSLTQAQKARLNEIAKSKGTPTGNISYADYGSPTETFSGIFPKTMSPLDASLALTMGGTNFRTNPEGGIEFLGGKYDFNKGSNPVYNFIDKGGIAGAADRSGVYDKVYGLGEKTFDLVQGAKDLFKPSSAQAAITDPVIDQSRISEIVEQQKAAGVPDEGLVTNFNRPTMADVAGPSEVERFKKAYDEAMYGMPSEEVNWYGTGRPNYEKLLAQYKNWSGSDPYFSVPETASKFESLFGKSSGYGLKDGGRVGLFMGGDPLTGQALAIYNSMNAYGFSDQEIANALEGQGYYTPGSSTPETTAPNIIGSQLNQRTDSLPTTPTSATISSFSETIEDRQNKLKNPGKIASFVDKFVPQQRSIADMLASGQVDKRLTGGIPLGVGSLITKALPDKYYDMSLADQITTQAYMGFTDPNTNMANKDPFGLNVRSMFGNYAEKAAEIVDTLEAKLSKNGKLSKYDQTRLDHYRSVTKTKQDALADIGLINLAKEQERKRQEKIAADIAAGKSLSQVGRENYTGPGMAFEAGNTDQGGGVTKGQVQKSSSVPGGLYGSPRKDGGLMYAEGGLVTMFKEKR